MISQILSAILNHRGSRQLINTGFAGWAQRRVAQLDRLDSAVCQRQVWLDLLRKGKATRFGREHGFADIRSLVEYRARVPLRTYDEYWRDFLGPHFADWQGVFWPEPIRYLALSSGTTAGTTKFLPVTDRLLRSNRKAAASALAFHVARQGATRLFSGPMFLLGGSTELRRASAVLASGPQIPGKEIPQPRHAADYWSGDLSGIVAREMPWHLRPFAFPPPELALLANWEEKLERLVQESIGLPVTLLSGVPSWLLVLMERVMQATGKATLAEVWPGLELVIHGGTSFSPYADTFRRVLGSDRIRLLETYPASEAFVAAEDPRHGLLRLIPDHGVFFEFVPLEELDRPRPTRHDISEIQLGVNYAVVLTTCAGLWSYVIGDTVTFESRQPPLFRFTGRTKYFLSAFGEHLICEEVDLALTAAARACQVELREFHVGPVFPSPAEPTGYHLYLVELDRPPVDLGRFREVLDGELQRINEDYAAHRVGDLTMQAPRLELIAPGGFRRWMQSKGKLGGQHKVPRLDNSGRLTNEMHRWFAAQGDCQSGSKNIAVGV